MKPFENYECEGQMSLDEIYPKPCCGLTPWLHKSKCWMDGREDIAQLWLMHYVCPKCLKSPVDKDGWIIRTRGTFEEAKAVALQKWNDPNIKKDFFFLPDDPYYDCVFDDKANTNRTNRTNNLRLPSERN